MKWFDRLEPVMAFIAFVCAAYVAVVFGIFIAQLIQHSY